MNSKRSLSNVVPALVSAGALLTGASAGLLGLCGPFTDVAADAFCPFVLEIFYLGITTGTTPTTYDPASSVTRLQMAAFLSRTVDGVLKRGSRRAAFQRFWIPQNAGVLGMTTVGANPYSCQSDGEDVWAANNSGNSVSRVHGSSAKLLETWTGASTAHSVLVAMNRVLVTGAVAPGRLYAIDPSQAAGAVTTVASTLGDFPRGIAFDGARVWTANIDSVSIVTPAASVPWTVTTVTAGFLNPSGALFDGTNVWITDFMAKALLRLDAAGAIALTVTVGNDPSVPVFDGTNIWVPNFLDGSVSVVRASTGAVLQTLTGNGLTNPYAAAFDGERVLVISSVGSIASLWKAADLSVLGTIGLGAGSGPFGACSDGVSFWIALSGPDKLARF